MQLPPIWPARRKISTGLLNCRNLVYTGDQDRISLMLHMTRTGTPTGTDLLIAHGLFGSARNWGVLSKRLSDQRQVIAVDMRNHGASPWFATNTYADMAQDLADVIDGQADIIGHSMGGKAAMMLALTHPEKVRRLIVADIAPVGYAHTQAHLIDAMQSVDLSQISSRRDADALLADHLSDAGVRAFLLQSLDLKGGTPRWTLNLEVFKAEMPKIIGFPKVSGTFSGPTLFLTGGDSSYVKSQDHNHIRTLFPQAEFQVIDGASHWIHAQKPREFEAAARAFLAA